LIVVSLSLVSVEHIDWTTTGAPPPIWIVFPLRSLRKIGRVKRRLESGTTVSSTDSLLRGAPVSAARSNGHRAAA